MWIYNLLDDVPRPRGAEKNHDFFHCRTALIPVPFFQKMNFAYKQSGLYEVRGGTLFQPNISRSEVSVFAAIPSIQLFGLNDT